MFAKVVFWFVAVNALAGAVSLILLPAHTATLFFWEVKPPINAALFGALYLGGGIIVGFLTYRGEWEPTRFLTPVLVSAGILISVTTFLHLDKFTPGFRLFYWLVVYIGAPLLAMVIYAQQERQEANWAVTEPVTAVVRGLALTIGALLLFVGVMIIIWPDFVVSQWPWPTSPLMVRIFASWFSAFGVGLLWFWVEGEWQRLHHIANLMIAAALFDLAMVFIYRNELNMAGLNLWIYCFHLAAFGALGVFMHWHQRRAAQQVAMPKAIDN
jgi:hypothetical protein